MTKFSGKLRYNSNPHAINSKLSFLTQDSALHPSVLFGYFKFLYVFKILYPLSPAFSSQVLCTPNLLFLESMAYFVLLVIFTQEHVHIDML